MPTTIDTGRELDWPSLSRQIGNMTVAAISGGRVRRSGPSAVELPCGSGYLVRVTLTAADDYTVERIFRRSGTDHTHGTRIHVYADEISRVAYYASSYRSYDATEWPAQA